MNYFIIETRELNRSKIELKVIATPIVVADNFFQALKIMDNHYSKDQYMHEIMYATGENSMVITKVTENK